MVYMISRLKRGARAFKVQDTRRGHGLGPGRDSWEAVKYEYYI